MGGVVTTEDKHWRFSAACVDQWALFDSVEDYNGRDHYPFLEAAREVCASCPVSDECRTFARRNKEVQGIWAGEVMRGK